MLDLVNLLRRALADAATRPVAPDLAPGPRHHERSRQWVEALADGFRAAFAAEPDVRVFSKHHAGNRAAFGLNELLYDVCVCRMGTTPSPRGRSLEYVRAALWQVESEFDEHDSREWVVDFNKLVLGAAPHKVFVGALGTGVLTVLQRPAEACDGTVHVALATHPAKWDLAPPEVRLWRLAGGTWHEEDAAGDGSHASARGGRRLTEGERRERLRDTFRPERVRVLFVGESPPAGPTFFYEGTSNLAHYTAQAFGKAGLWQAAGAAVFLSEFRRLGCFLVDLSATPVNDLRPGERREACHAGVPALADRLRELRPAAVIAVKTDLEPHVREALMRAGLPASTLTTLPFPASSHQGDYVEQLAARLRTLAEDGTLERTP